jgi:uncharacterized membrane protein YccC
MNEKVMPTLAFVVRCSGAATFAYLSALWIGLPHSIWAAMSALIVSQEQLSQTRSALKSYILGTIIGIGIATGVTEVAAAFAPNLTVELAVGVALCAIVAHERPALRVCMWTCPLVLLTADPSASILTVALNRASEVILGALIGGISHWAAERSSLAVSRHFAFRVTRRGTCQAHL